MRRAPSPQADPVRRSAAVHIVSTPAIGPSSLLRACGFAAMLALASGGEQANAQLYRHVDANGQVHITNTPPPVVSPAPQRPAQASTPARQTPPVTTAAPAGGPTTEPAAAPRMRSLVAVPVEPAPVSMPRIPEEDAGKAFDATGAATVAGRSEAAGGKSAVVMYSTSWCPYCARARAFFKHYRIEFTEIDIEKDTTGRADYRRLGGRGVPFIIVGEQAIRGFDERRLSAALGIQ